MNWSKSQDRASACETCPSYNVAFRRLGMTADEWDYVVALAGNPNTGKSTVFNQLTGLRQHTGNWPGKTIARAEGAFSHRGRTYKMVDLPGTYSLLSASPDEEVAREFILFGKPDVTVIVSDASCLERNLNLALQIVQITHRAVLCLNLMDEATSHSIRIDERVLAKDLGIPVIPCVARIGKGIPELVAAIHEIASGASVLKPYRLKLHVPGLPAALEKTKSMLDRVYPGLPHKQWIALRLLEGDPRITEAVSNGEIGMLRIDPHASLMSQSNAA